MNCNGGNPQPSNHAARLPAQAIQNFHSPQNPPVIDYDPEVAFQHLMWTLNNPPAEGLPLRGDNPPDGEPQVHFWAEQQIPPYSNDHTLHDQAHPNDHPVIHQAHPNDHPLNHQGGRVRPSSRSSQARCKRPPPEWAPDCSFMVQTDAKVPGVLFAREYRCKWGDCPFSTERQSSKDGADYQQKVVDHIKKHVGQSVEPSRCLWEGCGQELQTNRGYERNHIRHFTTHLPYYYLCPNCGQFRARPDVGPCSQGNCKARDNRIASRIAEARKKYGDLTKIPTIEMFYLMMHGQ